MRRWRCHVGTFAGEHALAEDLGEHLDATLPAYEVVGMVHQGLSHELGAEEVVGGFGAQAHVGHGPIGAVHALGKAQVIALLLPQQGVSEPRGWRAGWAAAFGPRRWGDGGNVHDRGCCLWRRGAVLNDFDTAGACPTRGEPCRRLAGIMLPHPRLVCSPQPPVAAPCFARGVRARRDGARHPRRAPGTRAALQPLPGLAPVRHQLVAARLR